MNEINFQRSSINGRIDYLFAIDDIEIVNEEAKLKNFDTIFRRKPKGIDLTEDESDEFLSRLNSDYDDEMDSFETESNLGLFKNIAKMKDSQEQFTFSEVLDDPMQLLNSQANPPLILLNLTYTRVSSNQIDDENNESISKDLHSFEKYDSSLKLYVQHFEIYMDKLMVGTMLKNFIKLQHDFMSLESNQRQSSQSDTNLNTSISSLNLSMHKETSISTLVRKNSPAKESYKSIMANFGGVSVFTPNTETFEHDSNILCFHLGEIKIIKGNPQIDRARRLLEDETEFSFKHVLDRNKAIMNTLNCAETIKQLKLCKNTNSEQVTYEVNDINVALCGISPDNSEFSEEIKIIKNFDAKVIYDTPISAEADLTAKIYLELDRIEFVINKIQLSNLIELSQAFQEDINKISSLAVSKAKPGCDQDAKQSLLNSSGLHSLSLRYSLAAHNHEMSHPPIEESKLLEESSDDDEKFFDAYDGLDDLDKDIYNQIQNK